MKRLLLLLPLLFLVAACGSDGIVKDGKFTFTEKEFKDTYEKTNDIIMPDNVSVYDDFITVDFVDKEDVTRLAKAMAKQFDSEEVERLVKAIEEGKQDFYDLKIENVLIIYTGEYKDSQRLTATALDDD